MKYPESYWTYKAPPTPEVADLPRGTFSGTESEWSQLSPGFRREIHRQAVQAFDAALAPIKAALNAGAVPAADSALKAAIQAFCRKHGEFWHRDATGNLTRYSLDG